MAFYRPRFIDPQGGMFHFFRDNGEVYDAHTRHLVSSTRFVFNCAMSYRATGNPTDWHNLRHAFRFLHTHHDPQSGGYTWLMDWRNGREDRA
ncbi:MAG: AGE family epimerase/isomerase [Burkholderiaceae bacterium]